MPPVGFEPTISAGERPKTYALDCKITGTGSLNVVVKINLIFPGIELQSLNPVLLL
jgi:hypothetical protein